MWFEPKAILTTILLAVLTYAAFGLGLYYVLRWPIEKIVSTIFLGVCIWQSLFWVRKIARAMWRKVNS